MPKLAPWPTESTQDVLSVVADELGMLAGALTTIELPEWKD